MTTAATATNLTGALNRQIANCAVLFLKLHHYHWFVKGDNFYELHDKFEQFYNEISSYMDELAERLLTIGGTPVSTMKQCLQSASVQEASDQETGEQMVQTVIQDFTAMVQEIKQGIEAAEQSHDGPTADLLIQMSKTLEKHVWMLRAYSGR